MLLRKASCTRLLRNHLAWLALPLIALALLLLTQLRPTDEPARQTAVLHA